MAFSFHQIPGSLVQIAAGFFNAWGVDANQNIFRFDGNDPQDPLSGRDIVRREVPGKLTQIAVGAGCRGSSPHPDQVWGINASDEVFLLKSDTQLFEQIPGASLARISVPNNPGFPVAWGINASQEIFRFNSNSRLFEKIPGSLVQIAVDDMRCFGIMSVYRRPLPSTNLGFLSTIMWDGREPTLEDQAIDATTGHAQAKSAPNVMQQAQIIAFETGVFTAQDFDNAAQRLDAPGNGAVPKL